MSDTHTKELNNTKACYYIHADKKKNIISACLKAGDRENSIAHVGRMKQTYMFSTISDGMFFNFSCFFTLKIKS
jgi:hypothetical protein